MFRSPRRSIRMPALEPLERRDFFAADLAADVGTQNPLALNIGDDHAPPPNGAANAAPGDIVSNGGFENGISFWQQQGPVTLTRLAEAAHSGLRGLRITNRTDTWQGIGQSLLNKLTPGVAFRFNAWVKLVEPGNHRVSLTLHLRDDAGDQFFHVDNTFVNNDNWSKLDGVLRVQTTGVPTRLFLYVEGPPSGVSMDVDDFSVVPFVEDGWRAAANERIEQIRKRDVQIEVVDETGAPIQGANLDIKQTRNLFGFGTAINTFRMDNPRYRDFLQQHFQWGVVENALKWPEFEPSQGVFDTQAADQLVQFTNSINMPLRGHNIFWEVEEFVPDWVKALNDQELRAAVTKRIQDVVGRYKNDLVHWDVNNEMLHGDYFQGRLGPNIRADMFKEAQALAPDITYFVNDYNVVAGNETQAYKEQIEGLLAQGAPVEAIGVQGHFNEVVPDLVLARLDLLAQIGLPIWFTEFDVVQVDPNVRAQQVEALYRLAFSHPAVEGALMWGFWAGAHWRGPNAALVDLDWTVNAAGQAYLNLMDEWSTEVAGTSSSAGEFDFRGFHGDYQATLTLPGGSEHRFDFQLEKGTGAETVRLVVDSRNKAPTLVAPASLVLTRGLTDHFNITVGDAESPPEQLTVNIVSNSDKLFPPSAIKVSGTGAERRIELAPFNLNTGDAELTIELRDEHGNLTSAPTSILVITPKRTDNIMPNGGFESGELGPMRPTHEHVNAVVQSAVVRTGANAALVSGRLNFFEGIGYPLSDLIRPGDNVSISAYVRLANSDSQSMKFTIAEYYGENVRYTTLRQAVATNQGWTQLGSTFTYNPGGPDSRLFMYLEGPPGQIDFYVDDVSVRLLNGVREGDVNGDGRVDLTDFSLLREHFGAHQAVRNMGDLNGDGSVNLLDFAQLRKFFNK